jgi:Tfp pilus assembly protein PilF
MKRLDMRIPLLFLSLTAMLFTVACATTPGGDTSQRSSAHYQLGLSYLNDNNIQPAFVEFQKALEINPNDKDVLNAIGVIHLLKLEDYPRAVEYFQRAIKVDRNFSEAWNNLGFAYEKKGNYSESIEAYKTAIANPLYKNTDRAYNNLGRLYYRMKRYQDAMNAYREALRRNSDFPFPYYGLALCYNAQGKYGDAATAIKKAIEVDPAYRGDREKALKDMRERKLFVKEEDEKDIEDLLEIMNY